MPRSAQEEALRAAREGRITKIQEHKARRKPKLYEPNQHELGFSCPYHVKLTRLKKWAAQLQGNPPPPLHSCHISGQSCKPMTPGGLDPCYLEYQSATLS